MATHRPPARPPARAPKLLLLASYATAEDLAADRVAGRLMLAGLDRRGIDWQLHQPWLPCPDLADFDAVLCWTYRWQVDSFPFWAGRIERQAAALGIPVVNGVERCAEPHSYFLRAWRERGVPCAAARRFARAAELDGLGLAYPLLVRRDGVHRGQDVHLVATPEEARALVAGRERDRETLRGAERPRGRFDLAIEFVDTADERGVYRKWRSYVVGQRVIPRLLELSRHWLVNFGNLIEDAAAAAEDRAFVRDGDPRPDLLREAARWTGADIVALDYARRRDGGYVFWEANRHFLMLGDPGYERPERMHAATGRSPEERRAEDERLGLAIADLVIERAAGARAADAEPSIVDAAAAVPTAGR